MSNSYLQVPTASSRPQSRSVEDLATEFRHKNISAFRNLECKICSHDVLWAPSPIASRITATLGQLKDADCGACGILFRGVYHFAEYFLSHLEPSSIHVSFDEWSFGDYYGTGRDTDPSTAKISITIKGRPVMKPIDFRVPTNHNTQSAMSKARAYRREYCVLIPTREFHCWGQSPTLTTTNQNIEQRKKGIPFAQLGKTFQHAILLTRLLGLMDLWIDSLCIIQDSPSDWEKESGEMASVYQNAYITIAASKGVDGETGLFSTLQDTPYIWRGTDSESGDVVERVRHPQIWEPLAIDPELGALAEENRTYVWMSLEPSHELWAHGGGEGFPLFTRAWALQERVLSPRTVHFGPMELFWECQRDTPTSGKAYEKKWQSLVGDCSVLKLTKAQNRLPALSGIAKFNSSKYLGGIWKEHLPSDLYWTSHAASESPFTRPERYRAPSFSWASIDGPIVYNRWRPESDLDEAMHRMNRQGYVVVKVLEASCTADGLDPCGKVKDGHIVFNGWTGEAVVSNVHSTFRGTICELRNGDQYHRFKLDEPILADLYNAN
ncbi:HET-domain-containing protein [Tothia fuscella]|uniref:HET-domain-containing protein n=1 Tax=Tothia fuscella TaxID=1048955 RepID=A0A9P4NFP3_9PEZI|nr:HET-domain-containing protein [Tothia fuscella]